jgi:hypothetical protein
LALAVGGVVVVSGVPVGGGGFQLMRYKASAALQVPWLLFVVGNQGLNAGYGSLQSSWIEPMSWVLNDAPIATDHAFDCGRSLADG